VSFKKVLPIKSFGSMVTKHRLTVVSPSSYTDCSNTVSDFESKLEQIQILSPRKFDPVSPPYVVDYKKLTRVIRYLRSTMELVLTFKAHNMRIVKWWADASYAVHADMRSHTGGTMSLGKGVIYGTSTRQKLNRKSSTEAELVGMKEVLLQVLWTRCFLESQG
jgi:hypothetical protein